MQSQDMLYLTVVPDMANRAFTRGRGGSCAHRGGNTYALAIIYFGLVRRRRGSIAKGAAPAAGLGRRGGRRPQFHRETIGQIHGSLTYGACSQRCATPERPRDMLADVACWPSGSDLLISPRTKMWPRSFSVDLSLIVFGRRMTSIRNCHSERGYSWASVGPSKLLGRFSSMGKLEPKATTKWEDKQ